MSLDVPYVKSSGVVSVETGGNPSKDEPALALLLFSHTRCSQEGPETKFGLTSLNFPKKYADRLRQGGLNVHPQPKGEH